MQDKDKEIRETAADQIEEAKNEGREMSTVPREELPPEILRRIRRHRNIK